MTLKQNIDISLSNSLPVQFTSYSLINNAVIWLALQDSCNVAQVHNAGQTRLLQQTWMEQNRQKISKCIISKFRLKPSSNWFGEHPDCLADSYKCLNVNWMAAGSRLSGWNHGFFLLPASFSNMFSVNIFKQAVGPSVLQAFSLWAVKPNK